VPRHVARLVVDFFAYAARPGASARRAARRRPRVISPLDFSSVGRTGSRRAPDHFVSRLDYSVRRHSTCCPVAPALLQPRRASRLLVSWQHRLYFEYTMRRRGIVFWSHRVDHSSRLVSKLVENAPRTTSRNQLWLVHSSNNCRGSISDRHGFINSLPRQQQLSHLVK
jgi:hypothetical protein